MCCSGSQVSGVRPEVTWDESDVHLGRGSGLDLKKGVGGQGPLVLQTGVGNKRWECGKGKRPSTCVQGELPGALGVCAVTMPWALGSRSEEAHDLAVAQERHAGPGFRWPFWKLLSEAVS